MTIQNIRKFMKQHYQFLSQRGIIKEGFQYRPLNIIDIAGFMHRTITAHLKERSWDVIKWSASNIITGILKDMEEQCPGSELIIVFDPMEYDQGEYSKLKQQTICKRVMSSKDIVPGIGYKQVCIMKRALYYHLKSLFQARPNVKIIVAKVEADIMVGSVVKKEIEKGREKRDILILSTDCDMMVFSRGCAYTDMTSTIYTHAFFKLFNFDSNTEEGMKCIAAVPEFLGCDYSAPTQSLQFLQNIKLLKMDTIIHKVYYTPDQVEDRYDLTYDKNDWESEVVDIFKALPRQKLFEGIEAFDMQGEELEECE